MSMPRQKQAAVVALSALAVAGLLFPAGSAAGVFAGGSDTGAAGQQATDTEVAVGVGEQLSTVVETTSSDIRTEAESLGFQQRLASANATERADLIAERALALGNRSGELHSAYERLTGAYRQGELTTNQYARQIATLSASATNIERSVTQLQKQASSLAAAERRAVGVTDDDLAEISSGIAPLTTATASAVLGRFTGANSGEISIEVGDRIEVSVESDGERSRQFERPRDDDDSYAVNQSAALAIAEEQLSGGTDAWAPREVSTEEGAYEFEFRYLGAGEGEAAVSVDGSSGTVFSLEESIEAPEDGEGGEQETLDDLVVRVVAGDPAPGSNVTLQVLGNGEPVENATVRVDEQSVGTTGPDGRIGVTFSEGEGVEISATAGEAEGELEFEFEDDERELGATASVDGQTITVTVVRGGQPLEGATVTLNENATETTDADGQATFEFSTTELEITIQYDDQEAELEYELDEDKEGEEKDEDDETEGGEDDGDGTEKDEDEDSEETEEGDESDDGDGTEKDEDESEEQEEDEAEDDEEEDDETEDEDDETEEDDEDDETEEDEDDETETEGDDEDDDS